MLDCIWQVPTILIFIVLIVIWLLKKAIPSYVDKYMKHNFDKEIENIKHDIREQENILTTLQNTVLSIKMKREELIYQKELQANEKLWQIVMKLSRYKAIDLALQNAKIYDFENWDDTPKALAKIYDLSAINELDAKDIRPFVSEILWSYFMVYRTILIFIVSQIDLGINYLKYNEPETIKSIKDLLSNVLPDSKEQIQKEDDLYCFQYLTILEDKMVEEIKKSLAGDIKDKKNLDITNYLINECEKISNIAKTKRNK